VRQIEGVGVERARLLERIGISAIDDLLWRLPRRLEDRRRPARFDELRDRSPAFLQGRVLRVTHTPSMRGRPEQLTVLLGLSSLNDEYVTLRWFQAPYLVPVFSEIGWLVCYGRLRLRGMQWEIQHPEWEPLEAGEETADQRDSLHLWRIVPIYGLTEGLTQRRMRMIVRRCLDQFAARLPDPVPVELQRRHGMRSLAAALEGAHFPKDLSDAEACRNRLAFTEAYMFLTYLRRLRAQEDPWKGSAITQAAIPEWLHGEGVLPREVLDRLGFEPHAGQRRVIQDLGRRLVARRRFRCLLQADVGAGKTVVALGLLLAAAACQGRGVLMAPTVLLARQHFERLSALCHPLGFSVGWIGGGQNQREREAHGKADILVGTHALMDHSAPLQRTELVVIDEQHRFGVRQRQALYKRAPGASILVMSATPIPRTLAQVQYADLDIVVMQERPGRRAGVRTQLLVGAQARTAYQALRTAVEERGERGYVVFPSIDGLGRPGIGEVQDPRVRPLAWSGVFDGAARLEHGWLRGLPLTIVHGRMSEAEKASVMETFQAGARPVLLGTTVVEVGLDVPEATVMVIEHAERFGLATLHQLRGRVGRGRAPGTCFLIARGADAEEQARLQVLVESEDGFEIAERDLSLRGPGEVGGERQSGAPEFAVFDPFRDRGILNLVVRSLGVVRKGTFLQVSPPGNGC
jgi:ATP-dependent DNA helicase RecG